MPRVIILTTSSQVRIGNPVKLEEFQQIVGGYIETVAVPLRVAPPGSPKPLRIPAIMVVNEEGLLRGLPRNILAERFLTEHVGPLRQPIVGDVFITSMVGEDFGDAPSWVEEWADRQGVSRG